jgi:hypothetical protein
MLVTECCPGGQAATRPVTPRVHVCLRAAEPSNMQVLYYRPEEPLSQLPDLFKRGEHEVEVRVWLHYSCCSLWGGFAGVHTFPNG